MILEIFADVFGKIGISTISMLNFVHVKFYKYDKYTGILWKYWSLGVLVSKHLSDVGSLFFLGGGEFILECSENAPMQEKEEIRQSGHT